MWSKEILGIPAIDVYGYFLIYSFLGWLMESIFVSVSDKKWVNRGFLNGPFCPIYGTGALMVLFILWDKRSNLVLLFIGGIIIASVVEYVVGAALEKLFHTTWWDYSKRKFNIKGRVCLERSLQWGVLIVVIVHTVQPLIMRALAILPQTVGEMIGTVFLIYITADTTITVLRILHMNSKLSGLHESAIELRERLDDFNLKERLSLDHLDSISIPEAMQELRAKMEEGSEEFETMRMEERLRREYILTELKSKLDERKELLRSKDWVERRLLKAYPGLSSERFNEELRALKERMKEARRKDDGGDVSK